MHTIRLTDADMHRLARQNPEEFLDMVADHVSMRPSDLTFAAEYLGEINDVRARDLALELLAHESPLVREGAIYGLRPFLDIYVVTIMSLREFNEANDVVRDLYDETITAWVESGDGDFSFNPTPYNTEIQKYLRGRPGTDGPTSETSSESPQG